MPAEGPAGEGSEGPRLLLKHDTLLNDLLGTDHTAIIECWAEALANLGNSPYREQPLPELRAMCATWYAAIRAVAEQHDQQPLREVIRGTLQGEPAQLFSLYHAQRAWLMIKAIVRPRLLAKYASGTDLAAFNADSLRFEHAVDTAVLRLCEEHNARLAGEQARELARMRNMSAQLTELAHQDELTGLFNYRAFQEHLSQEVRRSTRYSRPLALFMIDLDHFKQINDRYGHLVGNAVLQHVARVLEYNIRNTDILARYGGEEFAVILPETEAEAAVAAAEKLRRAVLAAPATGLPATSISIGIAEHEAADTSGSALIQAADAGLYAAKQAGRNRVVLAAPAG